MLGIILTDKQEKVVKKSIRSYRGNAAKLEGAIGALVVGSNYGWRVLKIIHSPATYKSYEEILSIKFQDTCRERTPLSKKSFGLAVADKIASFWAVATGKKSIKNKAHFDDEDEIQRQINIGDYS